MATGIFSTIRVAGEGTALATVAAGLARLCHLKLEARVGGSDRECGLIAQHLATGDFAGALRIGGSPSILVHDYTRAFASLLIILAVVTIVAAIAIFLFLRDIDVHDVSEPS
jgi:hypothetical protein